MPKRQVLDLWSQQGVSSQYIRQRKQALKGQADHLVLHRQRKKRERTEAREELSQMAKDIPAGVDLLSNLKVLVTTENNYCPMMEEVEDFLVDTEAEHLTMKLFRDFITAKVKQRHTGAAARKKGPQVGLSTVGNYRSAVRHFMQVYGWRNRDTAWLDSDECENFCKAASYMGGHAIQRVKRGAMDEKMFEETLQFFDRATNNPLTEMKIGSKGGLLETKVEWKNFKVSLEVLYFGALRISELAKLRVSNWVRHREHSGGARLLLSVNKRCKAGAQTKEDRTTYKPIVHPRAIRALNELVTGREDEDDYLIPYDNRRKHGHSARTLSRAIARVADEMKWAERFPGLKFDGAHTCRHGGMQAIAKYMEARRPKIGKEKLQRKLDEVLDCSQSNQERYLKTNARRMDEAETLRRISSEQVKVKPRVDRRRQAMEYFGLTEPMEVVLTDSEDGEDSDGEECMDEE